MLTCNHSTKGGATQVQVYRNNNGSFIALGNPFTPTGLHTDLVGLTKRNLVIQFGQYLYCSSGRDLRRFNPATQNWDIEVAGYASLSQGSSELIIGLGPTDTPRLIVIFYFSNNIAARYLDTPGGVWSALVYSGVSSTTTTWPMSGTIKFNNEIIMALGGEAITYNIATGNATKQLLPGVAAANLIAQSYTRVGHRLFALSFSSTAATAFGRLYERIGGTWSMVIDGATNQVFHRRGAAGASHAQTMFYDAAEDALIVMSWNDSTTASTLGTPGINQGNTNPGSSGLVACKIPMSMIGSSQIGPDGGSGFDFTATTVTRNDGGSWITDKVEVGSYIQVSNLQFGGDEFFGPVTAVTAGVMTIASASWFVNNDTTARFNISEQNLIGAIVPPSLQAPGGLDPLGDVHFSIEVDTDTDPTAPITYIWICVNNSIWTRFLYNGVGAALTALGSGGGRDIALSHNPQGGGEYFFDPTTTLLPGYHIEEAAPPQPLNNASKVFLRGFIIDETNGAPTPTDETVGLYYGLTGPTCTNLATITDVVLVSGPGNASPTIVANKIVGMTFDNLSIYSVKWQAIADGLVDQETHIMMPHVEL